MILGLLFVGSFSQTFAQGTGAAYVHIAAGQDFNFAIQSNGTLWAWGLNSHGQLGDGTTTPRIQPVAIAEPTGAATGSRWVRLFAHDSGSPVFGLRSDQTLWRWGANQLRPVQVALVTSLPSGATLSDLAFSADHYLALYSDGSLLGWGANDKGQLGIGAASATVSTPTPVLTPSTATAGSYWTSIEADNKQSFAVRSDGTLWSWGGVTTLIPSTLGHPVTVQGCLTPEIVLHPANAGAGTGWVSVKAGQTHTLGLRSDGTLWVWGYSNAGALGLGVGSTGTAIPLQVSVPVGRAAGTRWQRVQAGVDASQGILSDGSLWAWGNNQFGQLGVNSPRPVENSPQQDYNQEVWTQSVLGLDHAVALSQGRVYVTGNGANGQLGLGNGTSQLFFFVRVVGLPLAATAVATHINDEQPFPNPASSGSVVILPKAGISNRTEVVNSQGQIVANTPVFHAKLTLPTLQPGIYVLRLYDGAQFLSSCKLLVN